MVRHVVKDALEYKSLIQEFREKIVEEDSKQGGRNDYDFWTTFSKYQKRVIGACDFLGRLDDKFLSINSKISFFGGPGWLYYGGKEKFEENIETLVDTVEKIEGEIPIVTSKLDEEEVLRIEESYHTLTEECYWSSVINSAVALEKRLFVILKSRNTKFLKERDSNLRFSLGSLVSLYITNKKRFGSCIPSKHDSLMQLINNYRIISAHSKQIDIDRTTADAIFNLTLKFLMDNQCTPIRRKKK